MVSRNTGMCMGSSTNHVVAFDGLTLKLDGFCTYSLLRAEGAGGVEIFLHNGPCQGSPTQICMKAMEVKIGEVSVMLKDDMTVGLFPVFKFEDFTLSHRDMLNTNDMLLLLPGPGDHRWD